MKREFLQLAHRYTGEEGIGGWLLSEKLDGGRCFWDGGITRGMEKGLVPWANTAKDERYTDAQIATGLWSRYGNVIHAPDWFLDKLPLCPLDGELYSFELGFRQHLMSAIKKLVPVDAEWRKVTYVVFDVPPFSRLFEPGKITGVNFSKVIDKTVLPWAMEHGACLWVPGYYTGYTSRIAGLRTRFAEHYRDIWQMHPQVMLPMSTKDAHVIAENTTIDIVARGGEGTILRAAHGQYECARSHGILKFKPYSDMEGTVIGYTTGRETDKGSKLLGKMGALILELEGGKVLELSGFTDEERTLSGLGAEEWAIQNPGVELLSCFQNANFPRGARVTFRYRGMSADGIPQEARYWRRREDE